MPDAIVSAVYQENLAFEQLSIRHQPGLKLLGPAKTRMGISTIFLGCSFRAFLRFKRTGVMASVGLIQCMDTYKELMSYGSHVEMYTRFFGTKG
jgi:hypothetical protein